MLLNTSLNSKQCYKFQIVKDIITIPFTEKMKEYEDFFESFYLYTDGKDIDQIKRDVLKKLQEGYGCDEMTFYKFITFINEWRIREGKIEMLDKQMMAKFLTLCMASASIYSYSFGTYVSKNSKMLQKSVAKFTVTVVDIGLLNEIRRIWSDAKEKLKNMHIEEINRIRRLYHPNWQYVDDLNKLSDEDCSKLLWYIGEEYPLIVDESRLIYKVISLCSNKKFLIMRTQTFCASYKSDPTIWEKLSDLRVHPEVFKELTAEFKCLLPGWEVSLEDLILENAKFFEIITTNELIKMIENPCVINQEKEALPEPYLSRYLSGNFINLKFLEAVEEQTFIVLSNVQEEDMRKYSKRKNFLVMKGRCDVKEFKKICEERREMNFFYHFIMRDGYLQLIRNVGDISDLEQFRTESVDETAFYNPDKQNNINIISCDPGTGKSVLLRSLKNNLSGKVCSVILSPNDMSSICARFRGKEQDQIEDFILNRKFPHHNEFQKAIMKLLTEKGKICFLWDALDEICDENLKFIIDIVLRFSQKGYVQWITTRSHLKGHLEKEFNLLSTSMTPFDDQEQIRYIQIRLEPIGLDSGGGIIETVKRNIGNVLGIPLEIFMFTELFRQDKRKAANLVNEKLFSLSDLYNHFVDAKFDFFYNKTGRDIFENDLLRFSFRSEKTRQIEYYQRIALNMLFDKNFSTHANIEYYSSGPFQERDPIGLITIVGTETHFVHISYAEYFAALYFAQHYKGNLRLEDYSLFDQRYDNVRFFFDSLLAKDSQPHTAVLCKNLEFLKQYKDSISNCKDSAGRNLLHLASSWGERYDLFEVTKSNNETIINVSCDNIIETTKSDRAILEYLLERCDVSEVDDLFNLDCLAYAEKSRCLLNLVIIENSKKTGFLNSKDERFIRNILFYSVYFEYDEIIYTYKHHLVNLEIKTKDFSTTLLHMTSNKGQFGIVQLLIDSGANIEAVDKNGRTSLHEASAEGHFKIAQLLINSGANLEAVDETLLTPLHCASVNGRLELVQLLIRAMANIEAFNETNATPLHLASWEGQLEVAWLLITSGANIEAVDKNGRTSLHEASVEGHFQIAQLLINSGANLEAVDEKLFTPLHCASREGRLEITQLLINSGANIEAVDKNGRTSLHEASAKGHFKIAQLLINSGANLEAVDEKLFTPLHCASREGRLEITQLLIISGANIEALDIYGFTPLHAAVINVHFKVVQVLISSGANIEAVEKNGETSLHRASREGRIEITQLLINSGANIEALDIYGFTPLHAAVINVHFKVVQVLISSGANIEAIEKNGETSLHRASREGRIEITQLLINSGANIQAVDKNGRTSLHKTSAEGHFKVAQLLINSGANLEAVDEKLFTPLHCASREGRLEITQLLIDSGANIEALDIYGFTPLHAASDNGHFKVLQILINSGANIGSVDEYAQRRIRRTLHKERFEKLSGGWRATTIAAEIRKQASYGALKHGEFQTMELLIKSGENIEAVDEYGLTQLHHASAKGRLKDAQLLINSGANIEPVDQFGRTPLHHASANGQLKIAQLLIDSGANVEGVDWKRNTPLHHASKNEQFKVARLLIHCGANIEAPSCNRNRPLHCAAENESFEVAELLISCGANIETENWKTNTPLHCASENGQFLVAQLLIKAGANLAADSDYGYKPLHQAAGNGRFDVTRLLINSGAHIETVDENGNTPLHHASKNGQNEVAQFLINSGADIESVNKYGYTPLHHASENGHFEVAQLLINSGAKIETVNKYGYTPLHHSSVNGQIEITQLLIDSGAKIDTVDKYGCTALHHASKNGRLETTQLLISSGANIETVNDYGCTSLHHAAENGRLEIVQLLINSGTNIEIIDKYGYTPLHYASAKGRVEIVQLLIHSGSNMEAIDKYRCTPLHCSSENGKFEVVQLLINSGAKIEAAAWNNNTPLHCAVENGQLEVAQLLINSGANMKSVDKYGYTPLHCASNHGRLEVSQLLINSGANMDAVDKDGYTPLHCASMDEHFDVAQLLINSGANMEAADH